MERDDLLVDLARQIIQATLVIVQDDTQRPQQRLLQILARRTILFNLGLPVLERRRIAFRTATHVGQVVVYRCGKGTVGALDDEGGKSGEAEAGAEVALGGVDEGEPAVMGAISFLRSCHSEHYIPLL